MRQLSAVHVVVFNTFRSVIVWIFSLAIAWQIFQPLQLIGFIFIILGVIVFNDIVIGRIVVFVNIEKISSNLIFRSISEKTFCKQ